MIGQKKLLQEIDQMMESNFPRFVVIQGAGSCGKKTVAKYISDKLDTRLVVCGIKVDDIRDVITLAYKQSEPTMYLIADADKMSLAAKNALLKVTEEPPRKAYFIMTIQDITSTLETIQSRASVLSIQPYSPDELMQYATQQGYSLGDGEKEVMTNICTYPGEVDTLMTYDIMTFYNYVHTVVENIGKVSGANAFKIATKLAYKDTDTGWSPQLFLKAVMLIFWRMAVETQQYQACVDSIMVTSKYLAELNINGIYKPSTIDMWILDLRQVWMEN